MALPPPCATYSRKSILACRFSDPTIATPGDRPLPEEPLDSEQLGNFECPFLGRCELVPCPFGHRPGTLAQREELNQFPLRPIPWYFCMDRLLGRCESNRLERFNQHLVQCDYGFHPSNEDLMEPDQFTSQLASVVLTTNSRRLPRVEKCASCGKALTNATCAMLENCSHRFCGSCIVNEYEAIRPHMSSVCRVCGIASSRLMLWPQPVISRAYQQLIFSLQKQAFGLMVSTQSHVAVNEPPKSEQIFVYYKGAFTRNKIAAYQLESRNRASAAQCGTSPIAEGICVVCLKSIAASVDRIWAYLENCAHTFCQRCILQWRQEQAPVDPWTGLKRIDFACPTCRAPSARILLWPEPVSNAIFKNSLFTAQKMCLGLWVSTQMSVSIHERGDDTNHLAFICNGQVWIPQESSNSNSVLADNRSA